MQLPAYRWRLAHLVALWAYGVSQPVFSMLKGNPEFLVINGASRGEAVVFAVALAFGPPLVALAFELGVGAVSRSASSVLHVLFVWMFGFTALLQVLELFDPSSRASILAPAVLAYVGAMVYTRWRPLRSFLSVSVVLPVLGLLVFVTTAPLAVADAAGATVSLPGRTPVVVLVFDEFALSSLLRKDGTVDAVRYPGFGQLARDGTWYAHATTVNENTTFAVPAILTGDMPAQDALPTLADDPHNLFTLLGESYAFRVQEPVTRLCPLRYCPEHRSDLTLPARVGGLFRDLSINYLHEALPRDFRGNLSPLREGWGSLVENTGSGEGAFLRTMQPSDRPRTLYFAHLLEPHVPWDTLPSGRRYNDGAAILGIRDDWEPGKYEQWRSDVPWLVDESLQRHLLQVEHVDRFVQQVLRRLDETGIYDRALVVVTADHGVSFRPGSWRRHATPGNIADIAAVPLFVKYPGQRVGRVDRRDAQTIDVLPTIANVLGIRMPWPVDGRSLLAPPVRRNVRVGRRHEPAVVASSATVAAEVRRIAARNAALFGEGRDSIYQAGPRRALLGRPVATMSTGAARDAEVVIPLMSSLENVRKASGYVPAQILGRVEWSELRSTDDLAVAVNGRIAAVTRPYRSRGMTLFATMVDEDVLHDGRNDVDLYAVRGTGAATRLTFLGGNGPGPIQVEAGAVVQRRVPASRQRDGVSP